MLKILNLKKFQKVWVQYVKGSVPGVIVGLDEQHKDFYLVFVLILGIALKRSIHKDKITPAGKDWKDDYLKTINVSSHSK